MLLKNVHELILLVMFLEVMSPMIISYCKTRTFHFEGLCALSILSSSNFEVYVLTKSSCNIGGGQTSGESIKFPTILTDLNVKILNILSHFD